MAKWWERLPPTNVTQVPFPDPSSYVDWVSCWFSTLLREVFLRVLQFSARLKNQHFQIPIRSGMHGHFWTSSCEILGALWVNKFHLHFTLQQEIHLSAGLMDRLACMHTLSSRFTFCTSLASCYSMALLVDFLSSVYICIYCGWVVHQLLLSIFVRIQVWFLFLLNNRPALTRLLIIQPE